MKVLWISSLPLEVGQVLCPKTMQVRPTSSISWIVAHLPPPHDVELHIATPVLGLDRPMVNVFHGATFHLIPYGRFELAFLFLRWMPPLVMLHRSLQPDVVHGWGTEAGHGLAATRLTRERSVVGIQGVMAECVTHQPHPTWAERIILPLERQAIRRAKTVVCESEWANTLVERFIGRSATVVPHPLRPEFFESALAPRRAKRIVFVGTLCQRKGAHDALEAFLAANREDWTLEFIGGGELSPQLEAELTRTGRTNVRLLGNRPGAEIAEALSGATIFLLPTYTDTGPTALKEAIAMGAWPICYDNSGPHELLTRYQVGTAVTTGDIPALASALTDVMAQTPQSLFERTESAARRVRQDLGREHVWTRLLDVYRSLARST